MGLNETKKKALAEKMWLLYFNDYLYKQGIITEKDYNRMINSINSRKTN